MKNKIKAFLLFMIVTMILSCSKSEEESEDYVEQNFLSGFLQTTGFNNTDITFSGFPQHFGFSFTPLVAGRINSIVVKVPLEYDENRIRIWDKSTGNPIATKIVSLPAETEVIVDIEPVNLTKDKEYVISIVSMACYSSFNGASEEVTFPVVAGDIQINYCSLTSFIDRMPNPIYYNYYFGDLSFNFQRTE